MWGPHEPYLFIWHLLIIQRFTDLRYSLSDFFSMSLPNGESFHLRSMQKRSSRAVLVLRPDRHVPGHTILFAPNSIKVTTSRKLEPFCRAAAFDRNSNTNGPDTYRAVLFKWEFIIQMRDAVSQPSLDIEESLFKNTVPIGYSDWPRSRGLKSL